MCKHVAAALYGIGARLDEQTDLLFSLRKVDPKELIAQAGRGLPLSKRVPADDRVLATDNLSELFGLEMAAILRDPAPSTPKMLEKTSRHRRVSKASFDARDLTSAAKPSKKRTAAAHGKSATLKAQPKKAAKKKQSNAKRARPRLIAPAL